MKLLIRPIEPADGSAWLRMRENLWPGDDHAAEIGRFFAGGLEEPEAVLLAVRDGEAVGVCELAIRTDVPGAEGLRTGFVEGLYVEPTHRRGSVARDLLKAGRSWAKARDCDAFGSDRDERFVLDPSFPA